MDEILAIPTGRKRHNPVLLCAIMGVTALLMMSSLNLQLSRAHDAAPATASSAPAMPASYQIASN